MTALYRSGRQAEALRTFQRLRAMLDAELGLEPSERLTALERAMVIQDPELLGPDAYSGGRADGAERTDPVKPPLPSPVVNATGTPCVGRDRELAVLADLWRRARAGERQTAFLGGEPGIGKTRLACELGRLAHASGGRALYGRCHEDLAVPFQPFAEALQPCFEGADRSVEDEPSLARILPELGLRPLDPTQPAMDPDLERWHMFEDVARWLRAASIDVPTVMILEDLHWAAAPTLLLLRHLIRDRGRARLMIVATFRDTEISRTDPLAKLLADLRPEDGWTRCALTGLDEAGVIDYLEASSGSGLDEQGLRLAESLHDEATGNPLFIGEVLRHLIETGVVSISEDRWIFASDHSPIDIPSTVIEVIDRRIDRLSPSAREVLSVAACIGADFDLALVETVLENGDEVLEDLDRATSAGLVDEGAQPGWYAFRHSLIRRAVYEQQSLSRRARTHGRIGAALEQLHADDRSPYLAALCLQFAKALDPRVRSKASGYAELAARRFLGQLAAEEALALATIGLDVLAADPRPDRELSADLHLARAQALLFSGDIEGSKQAAADAAVDARATGSAPRLAAAAAARGWHSGPGDIDPMVPELCTEVLAMPEARTPELRAKALATLALYRAVNEGRAFEADPLAAESVELARPLSSPPLLWQALYARSHTLWPSPHLGDRLSTAEEMVRLAARLDEEEPRHQSHFFRGVVRLEGGDREGFEADAAHVATLAAESGGYWVPTAVANLWEGLRLHLSGSLDKAERCAVDALRSIPRTDQIFLTSFGAQLFAVRREQDQLDSLIPVLESAPDEPTRPAIRAGLALAYAEVGEVDRARQVLAGLVASGFAGLRRDSTWTIQMADVIDVLDLLEVGDYATTAYRLLAPYRGQLIVASLGCFCAGAVDRYLGMLATSSGGFDAAIEHFDAALALEAAVRAPLATARTRLSYARTLLARGRPGDRDLASGLLDRALLAARDMGLRAVERRAIVLQDQL
jgi:hypothetical protein